MNTKRLLLWMGLGLAAGCYAGIEDGDDQDFDRTRGACVFVGSSGSSSSYSWNCDDDDEARSAVVEVDGVLAAVPITAEGPIEDAILQNAGDMLGGIIADCLSDPNFAESCIDECGAMGLGWEAPGICQEEMAVAVQIVGDVDHDPNGATCPNGQPRRGAVVQATAPCMCQCGAPLEGGNNQPPPPPPGSGGGGNNQQQPPPPPPPGG